MSNICPSYSITKFLKEATRFKAVDENKIEIALTPVLEALIKKHFVEKIPLSTQEISKLQRRGIFAISDNINYEHKVL